MLGRKWGLTALCLLLALFMGGCSLFTGATVKKSPAQKQCEDYMEAIQYGEGLAEALLNSGSAEGIMHEVLEGIEYKILSTEEKEDGSILFELEITAVDMLALLSSLPEGIDSEEAAREAMLEQAETAARKSYTVDLTLVPVEGTEDYEVQPSDAFVNAITGGLYDFLREAFGLEESHE